MKASESIEPRGMLGGSREQLAHERIAQHREPSVHWHFVVDDSKQVQRIKKASSIVVITTSGNFVIRVGEGRILTNLR